MIMKKTNSLVKVESRSKVDDTKLFIEHAFHQPLTLPVLSQESGMSVSKLKSAFKDRFGISIHQYILELRINYAKQLLHETDLPVKAITYNCGFRNSQHFISTFKKRTGVTPGAFRKISI